MAEIIKIDDQPIAATFFSEGKWLTDFITPDAIDVKKLYESLTANLTSIEQKITDCWQWVASKVRYVELVPGKLWIAGKSSVQDDLWNDPSVTARVRVGNCANKSFLLTSLLRNTLPPEQVHCVLGNLYNGHAGGHSWVNVQLDGVDYIVESTREDLPVLVPAEVATRYEAVHLFNDQEVLAIKGRTQLEPFTKCYSTWLVDYLDWAYIEGRKNGS